MKPFSIVVTGEPTYINRLINCISYGPDDLIKHQFKLKNSEIKKSVEMYFGSLQVDEDHRIDFFGGNDEALLEFINDRPDNGFKGMIITTNADEEVETEACIDTIIKHNEYLYRHALVVGISGQNYTAIKQAEEQIRLALTSLNSVAPVFSIDPDNKEDVSLLVESLLCLSSPGIQENMTGKPSFDSQEAVK